VEAAEKRRDSCGRRWKAWNLKLMSGRYVFVLSFSF
jgi:hypothetical protein